MTTILVGVLVLMSIFLTAAIIHIVKIQQELKAIDKEQHTQNMDIINLMKDDQAIKEMLLQHIEILKYLCDQDPTLGRKVMYTGPIGEALIATAIGIAVALPAVLAYNFFLRRISLRANEFQNFSIDFVRLALTEKA